MVCWFYIPENFFNFLRARKLVSLLVNFKETARMDKVFKNIAKKYFQKDRKTIHKSLDDNVMKLIFNHLSVPEILKCSRVCKKWSEIIASEPLLTDRMRVTMIDSHCGIIRSFGTKDAEIFINSKRRYKHIAIYVTRNFTKDHLLVMAKFNWESVQLHNHTFRSEIELINFFGLIEPTIKELTLLNIRISVSRKKDITSPNFIFPALKILRVSNSYTFIISDIFKNVEDLEEFHLTTTHSSYDDNPRSNVERIKSFQTFLVRNTKITKLKLYINQKDFDNMFIDERFLSRIRFKLTELSTHNFQESKLYDQETNVVQIKNFGKFLISQKDSLQSLYLHQWIGNDVLELAINSLDSLRDLTVQNLQCYGSDASIANMSLFKNESIETLTLHAKHSKFNELQKIIVDSVPNLKNLNIGTVNQKILDVLIEKTLKLERINMDYFSAYIVPDRNVLPNLKTMNFNFGYASNFRDQFSGQHYYTHFEEVFLTAVDYFGKTGKCNFV